MWIMWITRCITAFPVKIEVFSCGKKWWILSRENVENVDNRERNLCSCAMC